VDVVATSEANGVNPPRVPRRCPPTRPASLDRRGRRPADPPLAPAPRPAPYGYVWAPDGCL